MEHFGTGQLVDCIFANLRGFYEESGSLAENAKYPEFALHSKRLKSFDHWPISLKQKPIQLSDAGFFYTGRNDLVICFSCGGSLNQWEENDDVWEEHAFSYGKCKYMRLCKGGSFHDDVFERKAIARLERKAMEHLETTNKNEKSPEPDSDEQSSTENSNKCQICCVNKYNTSFVPCGHVFSCDICAASLKRCPLCRVRISHVLKIFLPE